MRVRDHLAPGPPCPPGLAPHWGVLCFWAAPAPDPSPVDPVSWLLPLSLSLLLPALPGSFSEAGRLCLSLSWPHRACAESHLGGAELPALTRAEAGLSQCSVAARKFCSTQPSRVLPLTPSHGGRVADHVSVPFRKPAVCGQAAPRALVRNAPDLGCRAARPGPVRVPGRQHHRLPEGRGPPDRAAQRYAAPVPPGGRTASCRPASGTGGPCAARAQRSGQELVRACGLLLRNGPSWGGRATGRPSPLLSSPPALCRQSSVMLAKSAPACHG